MESKNIQRSIEVVCEYFGGRFSGYEDTWRDLFCEERSGGLDAGSGVYINAVKTPWEVVWHLRLDVLLIIILLGMHTG